MGRDLARGDLPTLILRILVDGPSHGYAIARDIERQSENLIRLREGSLYPALRVLEDEGFIIGSWEIQPSGPARKLYRITESGHAELARRTRAWKAYVAVVERMLGGLNDAQRA